MQITIIDTAKQVDFLRETWQHIYKNDSYATIFSSWTWLRGWIETQPGGWCVLAFRPQIGFEYVAFLCLRVVRQNYRFAMGGNPLSDHVGMVCLKEYEEAVTNALIVYLKKNLRWNRFDARDVFDPRLTGVINALHSSAFTVTAMAETCCPYISLPASWETYLTMLSSSMRKGLRSRLQKMEKMEGFRVTDLTAENYASQVEALFHLYALRWGAPSTHQRRMFEALFHQCFITNNLWLTILWRGNVPITGTAAFLDHDKRVFSDYIGGFDPQFAKCSPGNVMICWSIRYAIENGFMVYDLLRGAEQYKGSLGTQDQYNHNFSISRITLKSTMHQWKKQFLRVIKLTPASTSPTA